MVVEDSQMFGYDPIGEVDDMFGLGLLRWVRESEVRQKLLIEKGSGVGRRGDRGRKRKREKGEGTAHCLAIILGASLTLTNQTPLMPR